MPAASMTRLYSALIATSLAFPLVGRAAELPERTNATTTNLQRTAIELPDRTVVTDIDFERHIMGVLGRAGCNSGSCHGSFQGRGGFRVSLFGWDPEKDYYALTRDAQGRRVQSSDPDNSLVLLKSTGYMEHGGGRRFDKNSWQYKLIREWIAQGAPYKPKNGDILKITVTPPEVSFKKPGQKTQIIVKAKFPGGEENITSLCEYRVVDDTVADVTNVGEVSGLRGGDTPVVISYRGQVLTVRVMVPMDAPAGFNYPKVPEVNYVDREVFTKLRQLNIVPSNLSSDTEFLRRVTIDTIGQLPSPEEVKAFLNDKGPNKRSKKIDELLAHPLHAAMWATRFSDITGNNTLALENPNPLKPKRSQMWHDWFRKRVQDNMPYDQIVEGVLCATSRDNQAPEAWIAKIKEIDDLMTKGFENKYAEQKSLDLFWRRQMAVTIDQWGEKTAAAFMGVRLECAQCHKHPFDRWTQADYRQYANLFAQVTFGISPTAASAINAENQVRRGDNKGNNNQINQVREIFIGPARALMNHPETNASLSPKALGGPEIKLETGKDARIELMKWLRATDNPFFAKSFVNRIWGHYFGQGIVDPVDNFSLANPASNDKLLEALAKDFVEHKFDIRHMERIVLNSRTYQLTADANATNKLDKNNFSRSYVRPLLAEVVVDVLNTSLGVQETFGNDAPPNSKAIEVGSSQIQNPTLAYAFRIFGRSPRAMACDCERALEPALPQKLFLMTDPNLLAKIKASRLQKLLASKMSDEEIVDELFLATLTRYPTEHDKKVFATHRATKDRTTALTDTLWALINTREFILNH